MVNDLIDMLFRIFGFWFVLFNTHAREAWIRGFYSANFLGKLYLITKDLFSALFGIGIPGAVVYFVCTN